MTFLQLSTRISPIAPIAIAIFLGIITQFYCNFFATNLYIASIILLCIAAKKSFLHEQIKTSTSDTSLIKASP